MSANSRPARCFRDATDDAHPGRSIGSAARYVVHHGGIVNGRVGVGHGTDGSEPAARGRRRAGGDGLFVFKAGFAQVGVDVDETGGYHQAVSLNHPRVAVQNVGGYRAVNRFYFTVRNQHVKRAIASIGRGL